MADPTQVFIVTSGSYSDYGIDSVWLTLDEAKGAATKAGGDVEVWPTGTNKRTLGSFYRGCRIDYPSGVVHDERGNDNGSIPERHAEVLMWPMATGAYTNQLGINVIQETEERANKVFSEVRARVLAEISTGLPMEMIADKKFENGWVPTMRVSAAAERNF